ncbi:MAG: TetR/AcrR family transcriptional regulator [Rhodanobacteraceae bacterium]|nr:TetR/AcrR family transcriptional regulator [Rhodanobacteraceae bacterium]
MTNALASARVAPERAEKQRLTAQDWELAALELMAEEGVAAVAVESLARRLGVTKGSFYWHFSQRDALIEAALKRWEETDTHNLVARVESIENPGKRLRELFRLTSREMRSHKIYAALLKAADHPVVAPVMDRVSQERMAYLARVFQQAGMDVESATHRARLAYSAYVGLLQLTLQFRSSRLSTEAFDAYVGHMIDTLIPAE